MLAWPFHIWSRDNVPFTCVFRGLLQGRTHRSGQEALWDVPISEFWVSASYYYIRSLFQCPFLGSFTLKLKDFGGIFSCVSPFVKQPSRKTDKARNLLSFLITRRTTKAGNLVYSWSLVWSQSAAPVEVVYRRRIKFVLNFIFSFFPDITRTMPTTRWWPRALSVFREDLAPSTASGITRKWRKKPSPSLPFTLYPEIRNEFLHEVKWTKWSSSGR